MKKTNLKFDYVIGWVFLFYFLVEIIIYILTKDAWYDLQRLVKSIDMNYYSYSIYYLLRMFAMIVIPIVIIFLKKKKYIFILLSFMYVAIGNIYNPLFYLIPDKFVKYHNGIKFMPPKLGLMWSIISFSSMVIFLIANSRRNNEG